MKYINSLTRKWKNKLFHSTRPTSLIKLGIYQHFKGGRYEVIGVAKHSETLDGFVVYRELYKEKGLWIRPVAMFLETIERDGKTVPRFKYIK